MGKSFVSQPWDESVREEDAGTRGRGDAERDRIGDSDESQFRATGSEVHVGA
jgi:hypothetical protein